MKILCLVLPLFILQATFAADINVHSKVYNPTPGYFSSLRGIFKITYNNHATTYGDRVFLKYGYSGGYSSNGQNNYWAQEKKIEMFATSDYEWSTNFENEIALRGTYHYSHFDFVVVVTDTFANEKYVDNGTEGRDWSFYRLDLSLNETTNLRNFYVVRPEF